MPVRLQVTLRLAPRVGHASGGDDALDAVAQLVQACEGLLTWQLVDDVSVVFHSRLRKVAPPVDAASESAGKRRA